MYNKLYDNCFKTELNTKVLKVEEENGLYWHACKDTIFYVESGGMASDIGMMDNHMVLGLKKKDGYLWHLLDVKLEGAVFMSINLHERFRKCQIHTAQHLISAVLSNVYKVHTLAHHVGDEENDVEFDFPDFNEKMAIELQVLCNGLIRDDLNVSILYPTRAEALAHLPQKDVMRDDLRIVRIGALDYTLCGCMHVPSLRYLQLLFIRGFEKTNKGYKIKYLVGDQLLDCVERRYKVLDEVSHSLAISHLYLDTGVGRIINETRKLHNEVSDWKQKYYKMLAKELVQREEQLIIEQFEDIDNKSLVKMASFLCDTYQKAVILIGKMYDNAHIVVAANPGNGLDVKAVYEMLADTYHLKGNAGSSIAQGGGLYKEDMLTRIQELIKNV